MLSWYEFLKDHFLLNYVWLSVRLYVILKSYNLVLILILGTLHFYCFFFFFKFSVSQGFSVSVDFSEWDYVTMTSPRKQWKWSSNLVSVKSQGAIPLMHSTPLCDSEGLPEHSLCPHSTQRAPAVGTQSCPFPRCLTPSGSWMGARQRGVDTR